MNMQHKCLVANKWLHHHVGTSRLFLFCTLSVMRCRVCTTHSRAKRISHWWQQCWSIKDSTFYPENSANSGGQLTPRQPGSGASWRFSPPWSLWSAAEPQRSLLMRCCACCECGRKESGELRRLWLCARLCAALTGSEQRAGELLRGVIMHHLWRVYTGALWVFLFALAVSFPFLCWNVLFFFPPLLQSHINEISNAPRWPVLGWKERSSAY